MTIDVSFELEFPPKGEFIIKTIRAVTSFSSRLSKHPPRTTNTMTPSCDVDARFRHARAIVSLLATRAFCRHDETRCERQNPPQAKHRGDPIEKSKAFPQSNGQCRAPRSDALQFRRRTAA